MILDIRKFPDKILRQKTEPVLKITSADRKLVRDMFDTMYFAKGVGLAAPQVGILKRIIICNPTGQKEDELALINPKIIYRKGRKGKDCEGCLSIPSMSADVLRYSVIGVKGQDPDGTELNFEVKDLLARIVDHEADHLDGILFIDKIGLIKRKLLIAKYKKKTGVSCVGRWY